MTVKRGRPSLAAQSLDAALEAHYNGKSPKRPRNEFERQAMRKTKGRKVDMTSSTQKAALLAVYLINCEGLSKQKAAQQAGAEYGVHAANVRSYARKILEGPKVLLKQRKLTWLGILPPVTTPLLVPKTLELELFGKRSIDVADEHPFVKPKSD
jgi:hypothetical protein